MIGLDHQSRRSLDVLSRVLCCFFFLISCPIIYMSEKNRALRRVRSCVEEPLLLLPRSLPTPPKPPIDRMLASFFSSTPPSLVSSHIDILYTHTLVQRVCVFLILYETWRALKEEQEQALLFCFASFFSSLPYYKYYII